MVEKLTDTHVAGILAKQGINKDRVQLLHDYAPRSRGKEHSPFARFWVDRVSNQHIMTVSILPRVTNAGFFIVPQFRQVDSKFISEENCFHVEITGESVRVVCINDQPNGRKKDDWAEWHPQVFLDGVKQNCGNPVWLDTDVINPSYHFNTIQWDFGFCKRRARATEGRFRDRITLTEDPCGGELRVYNNRTGNMRLRYGSRDSLGSPIGRVEGDAEIITKEELANAIYPITIGASPETFYPDPDAETSSVDGYTDVTAQTETWAALRALGGDNAGDDVTDQTIVYYQCSPTTDRYRDIRRAIYLFDTSGLPDSAKVTVVVFSVYGKGSGQTATDDVLANVYASHPNSNTALQASDFAEMEAVAFCDSSISRTNWNTTGYNNFTLNASGLAAISKTSITKLGLRDKPYDADGAIPTWGNNEYSYVQGYFAEQANTTNDPKLVVTYTTGWAGGDVGGVAIAGIAKINGVALADITKVNGLS